jgi:hypothetical protein
MKAGLSGEWDPLGVVFVIKPFEIAFDRGDLCFIWSGLDDQGLDKYTVSCNHSRLCIMHIDDIVFFVADQIDEP